MTRQRPSPRVCELIRQGAQIALNLDGEFDERFQRTLAANPSIAEDPVLAAATLRSVRANLMHWAAANLRDPGGPVPANLGPEPLGIARDMVRRGLDAFSYRPGTDAAWELWMEIAFGLTSDPVELREMLDVSFRSISGFVDGTVTAIAAQMQQERDELTRGTHAERREVAGLLVDGAPISRERAEARLGYALNRAHTGAVIWTDESEGDLSELDRVAQAFGDAAGFSRPLIVIASAATRWVWVARPDTQAALDVDQVQQAVDGTAGARLAIGTAARGIEGFRSSHLEALTTQRMMARLRSRQRIAFFAEVQLVALLAQNRDGTDEFIKNTLGDFESASPELHSTVLTFINEQCSIGRTTKVLYAHRNTVLRRLERAQQLLPRPLHHSSVHVAIALEALRWRGSQTS